MLKIGSHVSMSGKDMFLNSVKEAAGYGANTFMLYTGAPQNTRRKPIEELKIQRNNQVERIWKVWQNVSTELSAWVLT